jgi:amidohydrolase
MIRLPFRFSSMERVAAIARGRAVGHTAAVPAGAAAMEIPSRIKAAEDELASWRRDLHAHPELGFEEQRTSDFVAERLAAFGCEVHRGVGGTGVVGRLRLGNSPRSIGLRADMDALPIREENTFAHRSQHEGKMHACGHDGHTTMLLGAARYLAETRNFDGTVHFIFQPAEEGRGGAAAMVKDGLFARFPCDAVFGMHNFPHLPAGKFAIRPGAMTAAGAFFDVAVAGHGSHAAFPEDSVDALVAASTIATTLQTVISRNVRAMDTAVLSLTQIHAGDAYNVIPQHAVLRGTVRTFSAATMALIEKSMRRIIENVAKGLGARAELDFRQLFPSVVNDPGECTFMADAAAELVGESEVDRNGPLIMTSEDFSFLLEQCPGAYILIGNGGGASGCDLHNPGYDFNDKILGLGATLYARLVERKLERMTG